MIDLSFYCIRFQNVTKETYNHIIDYINDNETLYYTYVCTSYIDTTNVLCIEPADVWYMYLTWQLVAWNEYYSKCLHFICLSIQYNFARDSTIHNARNGHFQQNSMYYFSRMVINYVDRITKLHLYFYTCIVCYPATLLPCTVPLLLNSNLTIYDGS